MRAFVNKEIVRIKTGWEYASPYDPDMIYSYVAATGVTDFLVSPEDYIGFIQSFDAKHNEGGRTKDDKPYFMVCGIKIIMVSNEETDKYKILI